MSFELDQSQLAAVKFASEGRFSIVNGGAGCGKTTIIKKVVEALDSARQPYSLCAPTGKAAARLKEATGIHASTVHSLLGYDGAMYRESPFPDKTIIIDESSMLDSCLLAEVVKRAPRRLILVGDQAQLTPVGAGQPFHDIIEYYPERVRTLTTCYRATEAVFKASSAIRRGEMPLLHDKSDNEVWDVYDSGEAETTQQVILEWVKKGVFNFETDIILAPKNGERNKETGLFPACTVNRLNEEIIKGQIKELVRGSVEETLNELLEKEAESLTQAARYERSEARQGYRSGHYDRNLTTTSGDVTLHIPRLKGVSFETAIIERYRRRESSVEEALIEMYLAGVSVRRVEDITEALWGSKVSPATISELNKKAYVHIEDWRNRPLQGGKYPYD